MSNSGIGQFIPLILIFVIFYFFLIRPQQKKVKDHRLMVENIKRGDKVFTVSRRSKFQVYCFQKPERQEMVCNGSCWEQQMDASFQWI